jgi:hypothetical protein
MHLIRKSLCEKKRECFKKGNTIFNLGSQCM